MRPAGSPRGREAGQTLVISILFLGVLLGFGALLIDGGSWMWTKRSLQGDADAAALASVRELPRAPGNAQMVAEDYVENRNSDDLAQLEGFASDMSRMTTSVTVSRGASSSPFGKLLGIDGTDIRARATARIAQVSLVDALLPFAALEGQLEFGNPPIPERITFSPGNGQDEGIQNGHIGAIAPRISAPACSGGIGNSATELERMIVGEHGTSGLIACGTEVGAMLDTATGDRPNAVRDGFNTRLGSSDGTHPDQFLDVFSWDTTTGRFVVEKSDSPRVGFIPVISTGDGTDDWKDINGTSAQVRVIDWVMVYIGRIGVPGEPAYVRGSDCLPKPCKGQQIQVYITPIRGAITPNFNYELRDAWDDSSVAPLAITLVE